MKNDKETAAVMDKIFDASTKKHKEENTETIVDNLIMGAAIAGICILVVFMLT